MNTIEKVRELLGEIQVLLQPAKLGIEAMDEAAFLTGNAIDAYRKSIDAGAWLYEWELSYAALEADLAFMEKERGFYLIQLEEAHYHLNEMMKLREMDNMEGEAAPNSADTDVGCLTCHQPRSYELCRGCPDGKGGLRLWKGVPPAEAMNICQFCGKNMKDENRGWCSYCNPEPPAEDFDHTLVRDITRVVRAADVEFEEVGGTSRHWVRDHFLPHLHDEGLAIMRAKPPTEEEEK